MKILYVTHRYPPDLGGIENVVFNQANEMVKRGHEVCTITTTSNADLIGESWENGVRVIRCRTFSPNEAYFFSPVLGKTVNEISENFDIVHAHNYHAFPAFHGFRNRNDRPFVLSCHYHRGSHKLFRNLLHFFYRKIAKKMVEGSDLVSCVSSSEMKMVELDFTPRRIMINYNGIEVKLPERRMPESNRICYVGRLERYKNVDLVINTLTQLQDISLDIVGTGADRDRLVKLVERKNLGQRVSLHGHVSEERKSEIISSSKCLVSLSEFESFGITLLESAMLSVPIIASRIPPFVEISEKIGGRITLVEPNNSDEVVRALENNFKNKEIVIFDSLVEFTWKGHVDRLESSYNELL